MKKSRVSVTAGALVLAAVSIFGTKANKKMANPVTIYYLNSADNNYNKVLSQIVGADNFVFTTTSTNNAPAGIGNSAGSPIDYPLYYLDGSSWQIVYNKLF